jgi:hypothetical protein
MAISKKELEKVKNLCRKVTKKVGNYEWDDFDRWDNMRVGIEKHMKVRFSNGGYAGVFIPKDKKYVIKVIGDGENDGYTEYAQFCLKNHKKFPNLPKVYSLFKSRGYQFFIIEKLQHNSTISNKFENAHWNYTSGNLKKNHKYYNLFVKLDNTFGKNKCNDIGGSNVMVRKGGMAVLTDPIAD